MNDPLRSESHDIEQKKLDVVFERARGCQVMVLQLVSDPLNCLQYGHLCLTQNSPSTSWCESSSTRSCGRRPCGTSCTCRLSVCQCQYSGIRVRRYKRTGRGRDHGGVVGVQHVLGVGALWSAYQHGILSCASRSAHALRISPSSPLLSLPLPMRVPNSQPTFCHCLRPSWVWWSFCQAGTLFLR